ncbi:MAG: hypothetical protein ACXWCG_10915, partial [Flavitalea sp.]
KKVNAMALLDSLVSSKGQNIEQWEPINPQYTLMNKELSVITKLKKLGVGKRSHQERKNRTELGMLH